MLVAVAEWISCLVFYFCFYIFILKAQSIEVVIEVVRIVQGLIKLAAGKSIERKESQKRGKS